MEGCRFVGWEQDGKEAGVVMTAKQAVLQSFPEAKLRKVKSFGGGQFFYYVALPNRFPTMMGGPSLKPKKAWEFARNELGRLALLALES